MSGYIYLFFLSVFVISAASHVFVAVFNQVNWDEFFFLSKIYLYEAGSLTSALQTGYVHFFVWLTHMPGNEVDQVVAGRLVMFLMQCGTLWLLFRMAKSLLGTNAALFALLAYSTFSFVTLYGASFRADPMAGLLMMWATYLVYSRDPGGGMVFGVALLIAGAVLVTVKAVLLVPLLILIALVRTGGRHDAKVMASRYALLAATTVCCFAFLYFFHERSLGGGKLSSSVDKVTGPYTYVIQLHNLFPRRSTILETLEVTDSFYYLTIACGFFFAIWRLIIEKGRCRREWFLLVFSYPLLILVFYRNAFPYFFPFILPTVSLLAGYLWYVAESAKTARSLMLLPILAAVIFGCKIYRDGIRAPIVHGTENQRQTLAVVHRMFPEPVPYLDGNSMVSSFPKAGFFMSTWGLKKYFDAGDPLISAAITEMQPKFIVLNTSTGALANALYEGNGLLPEDVRALQSNYIPHWGAICIAGKKVHLIAGQQRSVRLMIAGPYTLESSRSVLVDGRVVEPGAVIQASSRPILLAVRDGVVDLVLRYGNHIYRPEFRPLSDRLYTGF